MKRLTRMEFDSMTFEEVMEYLNDYHDEVTHIEILKEFIKNQIDNDDFGFALYLLDAIYNDPNTNDTDWYLYDYTLGTLDTPVAISCKEDVEHLIDD